MRGKLKKQYIYLMIASAIVQFFYSVPNTTISLFVLETGGGEAEVGLIGGIISVGALFFRGIIGFLTDTRGRKRIYIGGILLFALTTFGYAISPDFLWLLFFKALSGLALCMITSGGCSIVADLSGDNATKGLTALMTVQMVSGLFAPSLGIEIGARIGYRMLYVISAIGFLPALPFAMAINYEQEELLGYEVTAPGQKFRILDIFEKKALVLSVGIALLGVVVSAVTSFLASYGLMLDISNVGFFYIVNGAMTLAVYPLLGKYSGEKYNSRVFYIGIVSFIVSLAIFFLAEGSITTWSICAAFYSVGYAAVQPVLNAVALRMSPPDRKGAVNATCYMAWDIGYGVGSGALGIVAGKHGYPSIYLIGIVCTVLMAVIYEINAIHMRTHRCVWKNAGDCRNIVKNDRQSL